MSEGMLAAIAGIAAAAITFVQWVFALRAEKRQRDVEMTTWGNAVISTMASIETACSPISANGQYSSREVELLGERASALVDQGRLFFPNVMNGRSTSSDEGTRVKLLDQVLRACYVARHIAADGPANRDVLRRHVWEARGRFVSLLQKEMGPSLREVGADSSGDHIPSNPEDWAPPQRDTKLPLRKG